MRISVIHRLAVVVLAISCGQPRGYPSRHLSNLQSEKPPVSGNHAPPWYDESLRLLQSGRCSELEAFLTAVPQDRRPEDWYVLSAMGGAMCWRQTRMEKYKAAALQVIEKGITHYPDSALLIANKGALLEGFGDVEAASRLYRDAYRRAQEHLRSRPESRDDRYVFDRMSKRLGLRETGPPTSSPLLPAPADDLVDARPQWQQEAWRLMANDCRAAIKYLDAKARPSDPMWYVTYSQADLLCWQNNFGGQFREHEFEILDQGLKVLPTSSRLLMSKAEAYETVGDQGSANQYYDAARTRAQANITNGNRAAGFEDKEVLEELRRRRKQQ